MALRARLLLFVALPLAAVTALAGAGIAWWRWDSARQPTVSDDIPAMDQAIAVTMTAAGDQAAVAISGVLRAATCRISPVRKGGEFTRSADLYTDPGGEDDLISRIAGSLPAGWQPRRGAAAGGNAGPLTATIGTGVRLSVRQLGPGWVTARARTGCTGGKQPADGAPDATGGPATEVVNGLLSAIAARPGEVRQHRVTCPQGGSLATLAVLSQPTDSADLAGRLRARLPGGARLFTSASNRVSYRDGPVSVIVAASDDNTAVTVRYTTTC
ncbi:hypothetical protein EV384_2008 [Micromonospora kangleipakensis]|uniref:Uncharacterized protein n=1 Tax=Micromonospora kangleipakensis TaxID=1077942 RepID=A0A4Q8B8Z2_9ACTN|nr:hypothetical protein [Micromonospora kangleipakensis]RZU73595.1 hypothetical protein EV384_2008 [Micromonospora kangleipakensis]